jgi:hypothetical protein
VEFACGEADDEVEFSTEGFDEAAEGADLHVGLGFELGEGGLFDPKRFGDLNLGEAGKTSQFDKEHALDFMMDALSNTGPALRREAATKLIVVVMAGH